MALENACFAPIDQFSRRQYQHLLIRALPRGTVWGLVAVDRAGTIVGVTIYLLRRGSRLARLYTVSVAPAARGQGLASALIRRAVPTLRRRGITRIGLEVRVSNVAARRVYERLGFTAVRRFDDYYDDSEAGLRYVKRLSAHGESRTAAAHGA